MALKGLNKTKICFHLMPKKPHEVIFFLLGFVALQSALFCETEIMDQS